MIVVGEQLRLSLESSNMCLLPLADFVIALNKNIIFLKESTSLPVVVGSGQTQAADQKHIIVVIK
jgi:hypothetical protein